MAPSVPLQACFRKWSGLYCVESYLIVSSAVLKVLISAHRGDWLWVKCALMNTNLRRGLGGIRWVSESSGQVIRLLQVYRWLSAHCVMHCGDAQTLRFLPGGNMVDHCPVHCAFHLGYTCDLQRSHVHTSSDPKRLDGFVKHLRVVGKHKTLNMHQRLPKLLTNQTSLLQGKS